MQELLIAKGIPASGKSSWARAWVAEKPLERLRFNNDDQRNQFNGGIWSKEYEQLVVAARKAIVINALKAGKSVCIDNLNLAANHWKDAIKWAREANVDCVVSERVFYIDLETAVERDSKREGNARIGRTVIEKWWRTSGKESFKDYQPKTETITKREKCDPPTYDPKLQDAVICDLDGSLALFEGFRNPYDAKDCDLIDQPNETVVSVLRAIYEHWMKDYHKTLPPWNVQMLFVSGRKSCFEPETRRFIDKHWKKWEEAGEDAGFTPYKLLMRDEKDERSDDIVKEEIYRTHIEGKYNVRLIIDDRLRVCRMWHRIGLGGKLLRVGDPDANF